MVYELEKEHKKSSLMCKKKEELVKEIMRLEHNVNVMNERLNNQANAAKKYEQESRDKAIDEFAERLKEKYENCVVNDILMNNDVMSYTNSCNVFESFIDEIAEEMRGAING